MINFSQSAIISLEQIVKLKDKQIYRTALNLLKGLDNRLQLSRTQDITRASYWQQAADDGKKIQHMMQGLMTTYGSGPSEQSVLQNIIAMNGELQQQLEKSQNVVSPAYQVTRQPVPPPEQSQSRQTDDDPQRFQKLIEAALKQHHQSFYQQHLLPLQTELGNLTQQMRKPEADETNCVALQKAIRQVEQESSVISSLQHDVRKLELKVNEVYDALGSVAGVEHLSAQNEAMRMQLAKLTYQFEGLIQNVRTKDIEVAETERKIEEVFALMQGSQGSENGSNTAGLEPRSVKKAITLPSERRVLPNTEELERQVNELEKSLRQPAQLRPSQKAMKAKRE